MCFEPKKGSYRFSLFLLQFLLPVLLCLAVCKASAQNKYTLSGTITDAQTGESLIGASVKTGGEAPAGIVTNDYGFYSLTLPEGEYTLQISYVGYKTVEVNLNLQHNVTVNRQLNPSNELSEVVVTGKVQSRSTNITGAQMGVNKLDVSQINNIPVLLGEKDVLKTIQLLPGVKTTGDAYTGFYVRGGGTDQNLILLDGAPVYNATHLFGFFSIFNADAIKEVDLYKGGMPASYGGRLSSVLDIRMDDGNKNDYGFEGGIGLIASRIKAEGPLVKGKSSFMVSARRTYADAFLKLSGDSSLKGSSLYFYDLNIKLNYQLSQNNTLYLSAYYGKDNIGLKDNFASDWGNAIASLRWNHIYSSKLFGNTSFNYSNYQYSIHNLTDNNLFNVASQIRDFSAKEDFNWFLGNNNKLGFGAVFTRHSILPGNIVASPNSVYNSTNIEARYANEAAAYLMDDMKLGSRLNVVYGIRLDRFEMVGPGNFSIYNAGGNTINTVFYAKGDAVATYVNAEPRLSANFTLNSKTAIKFSYNHNTQNIHLLSNSTAALPTDLYVLSSNNIKPGVADQLSLGWYRNAGNNMFEFSAEAYYKWLQNQIDYKNNAQLVANQNVESQLLYGVGRAYGLELYLKKNYGRVTGWLGYTLSRVEDRFDGVNNGNYFPARQDRLHDLSAVGIFKWSKRVTLSASFVYGTGNAITFPDGKYSIGGVTTYYYQQRNGYRMPADHRLDLGVTWDGKPHKNYRSGWTFGIYNVYNHKNPYSIIFRDSKDNPPHTEAVETSLFGIIPSVTWNFKF